MNESDFERMSEKVKDDKIDVFKKALQKMIATSEEAYSDNSRGGFNRKRTKRHYSAEEIHEIIVGGDSIAQANLSEYFFATNGLYKRIIIHYAAFLTYSWILVPYTKNYKKDKIYDDKIAKSYFRAADFCTNFQIERKCALFARDIFVKGAYYGLVLENGDNVVIADLPFDYCRSRFKNQQDVDIIEFNLEFFKKITDDNLRKRVLETFPKFIQKAWRKYAQNKGDKWIYIPAELGIYFRFFEERPFFLDLIPLLASLDEYKEIDKERNIQALKRILVQEIPHDGMKLVFEPQEAESMHNGAISMLQNNRDVDVITSYAKVNLLDMSSKDDEKTDIQDMQDLIYSSAGVSKELFFATTAAGIEYSVNNDLALAMILGQSFAHFFTVLLNYKFETTKVKFKLLILPISYYNSADYTSRAKELAAFGYSFLTPILSTGLDQTNLAALKALENDLLDLDRILKPLQSSYTQSGKKAGEPMDEVAESGEPTSERQTEKEDKEEQDKEEEKNEKEVKEDG